MVRRSARALGLEFFDAVDATIDQIVTMPRAGALVPRMQPDLSVRRRAVTRFPYHVVYLRDDSHPYSRHRTRPPETRVLGKPSEVTRSPSFRMFVIVSPTSSRPFCLFQYVDGARSLSRLPTTFNDRNEVFRKQLPPATQSRPAIDRSA